MALAMQILLGKPVACNYGLPSLNCGLFRGIVAAWCFGLLGLPGKFQSKSLVD